MTRAELTPKIVVDGHGQLLRVVANVRVLLAYQGAAGAPHRPDQRVAKFAGVDDIGTERDRPELDNVERGDAAIPVFSSNGSVANSASRRKYDKNRYSDG